MRAALKREKTDTEAITGAMFHNKMAFLDFSLKSRSHHPLICFPSVPSRLLISDDGVFSQNPKTSVVFSVYAEIHLWAGLPVQNNPAPLPSESSLFTGSPASLQLPEVSSFFQEFVFPYWEGGFKGEMFSLVINCCVL